MKIEVKRACEIEGQTLAPDMRKKPRTFIVPLYFVLVEYFVAIFKEGGIKILDVSEEETKNFEETIPEHLKNVEPDADIMAVVEGILMAKEPKEGEEDDKEPSTASDSSDASQSSSEGSGSEPSSEPSSEPAAPQTESSEKLPESKEADKEVSDVKEEKKEESAEEKEFAELHEKAKRLNKNEKKRYDELKEKLKK